MSPYYFGGTKHIESQLLTAELLSGHNLFTSELGSLNCGLQELCNCRPKPDIMKMCHTEDAQIDHLQYSEDGALVKVGSDSF